MTSATERLRALLDERGVEWRERVWGGKHSVTTFWNARGVRWHYRENRFGELRMHADGLTPEQAIAATLGPGTCHDDGDPSDFCCSECGVRMFTDTSDTYTMIASDGHTIIKHPNYCPNCGRRVVE